MSSTFDLQSIHDYLFLPTSSLPLEMFRILLGTSILIDTLWKWRDRFLISGAEGLANAQPNANGNYVPWPLFNLLPESRITVTGIYLGLIFGGLAFLVGFATPVVAVANFILVVSICDRTPTVFGGELLLMKNLTFLSIFLPLGHALSVDAWLDFGNLNLYASTPMIWPLLIQVFLSIIYLQTYLFKISNKGWHSPVALRDVLRQPHFGRFPNHWLCANKLFSSVGTYSVLLLQGFFPIFIWVKEFRLPLVLAQLLCHAMIGIFLRVGIFSVIISAALAVFVPAEIYATALGIESLDSLRVPHGITSHLLIALISAFFLLQTIAWYPPYPISFTHRIMMFKPIMMFTKFLGLGSHWKLFPNPSPRVDLVRVQIYENQKIIYKFFAHECEPRIGYKFTFHNVFIKVGDGCLNNQSFAKLYLNFIERLLLKSCVKFDKIELARVSLNTNSAESIHALQGDIIVELKRQELEENRYYPALFG